MCPKAISTTILTLAFLLIASASIDAAERTSETDKRLADGLKRFPQADANKDGILTQPEARAFQEQRKTDRAKRDKRKSLTPTNPNISYGPHDRNVLDLWLAKSDVPTPLLVCIHGGGFKGGDRSRYYADPIVPAMLNAGISVATINYRLTDGGKQPYPIPMHDGARAIQFLRLHADRYHLDPSRVATTGGSAGACMSMWLAFRDDLADPNADDPVLRQSTRLTAIAPNSGQPILHPRMFDEWFAAGRLREHPALRPLFGIPAAGDINWTDDLNALMTDASPITHLTPDDPPVYLTYGSYKPVDERSDPGVWVHHPLLGIKLKEAMDELGTECHLNYPGIETAPQYKQATEFLIAKLKP